MRGVAFRPAAQAEIQAAFRWYCGQRPELGAAFRAVTNAAISEAVAFPLKSRRLYGDVRAVRVRRFPYFVCFVTEPGQLVVLAVLQFRRRPVVWQRR